MSLSASAYCPNSFDPEKYNRDLECAISKEAKLTPQEAQAFFPVFREFQQKQRELYKKQRQLHKACPKTEKEAQTIINDIDATDIAMHKLQQSYHARFLKILPATKVLACIRAEEAFTREMMRKVAEYRKNQPHKKKDNCKK